MAIIPAETERAIQVLEWEHPRMDLRHGDLFIYKSEAHVARLQDEVYALRTWAIKIRATFEDLPPPALGSFGTEPGTRR